MGSALGFVEIQANWGRGLSPFGFLDELIAVSAYRGPPMDLIGLVFGVALIPFLWRYLPPWLALYGTAGVAFPLLTGSILSFGRFVSVSFPHFLCLAKLLEGWRLARVFLVGAFVLLQTLVARGLMAWLFVG